MRQARAASESAVGPVAAVDAPVTADDYRLVGGTGPTSADLDELAHVERVLARAADRLDSARAALDRGVDRCALRDRSATRLPRGRSGR